MPAPARARARPSPRSARRVVASSRSLSPDERFDVLVHALAQLPDRVVLDIAGTGPDRPRLERLAAGYGISNRARFGVAVSPGPSDLVVYPSPRNAASAPVRPESVPGRSVVVDLNRAHSSTDGSVVGTMAELVDALSAPKDPPASLRTQDGVLEGRRIAIIVNIPAHYRVPLFGAVAGRVESAGGALRVFFLAPSYDRRSWMRPPPMPFDHTYLKSLGLPLSPEWHPFVPRDLEAQLARFRPDVVLAAGFSPAVSARAALYAGRRGIPFGLWSGEIEATSSGGKLRTLERRWLARRASFAVAYGSLSGEYLRLLRPDLPVVHGRNTAPLPSPGRRPARRRTVEVLSVGSLTSARKGLDVLIDALRMARSLPYRATMVGDGRLRPPIEARARGLEDRIRFVGAVPSNEIPGYYRRADVFAFPSRADVFGLALVEAMGAGLAVVVSGSPGAVADLCVSGRNCLVVPDHDPRSWADALALVVTDHELRQRLGEEARRTIERRWTVDHSADALVAGLRLGLLEAGRP